MRFWGSFLLLVFRERLWHGWRCEHWRTLGCCRSWFWWFYVFFFRFVFENLSLDNPWLFGFLGSWDLRLYDLSLRKFWRLRSCKVSSYFNIILSLRDELRFLLFFKLNLIKLLNNRNWRIKLLFILKRINLLPRHKLLNLLLFLLFLLPYKFIHEHSS